MELVSFDLFSIDIISKLPIISELVSLELIILNEIYSEFESNSQLEISLILIISDEISEFEYNSFVSIFKFVIYEINLLIEDSNVFYLIMILLMFLI